MRAVSLWPLTLPTIGEVFVPIVIEMAGSSTWIAGSGRTSSGSASVSPIVISSMPATATMSPGPALSAGKRSRALVFSSSVTRTFECEPSWRTQATVWPFLMRAVEDAQQREAAEERRRVEVGDPGLQRGLVVVGRGGDVLEDRLEQRLEVVVVGQAAVLGLVSTRGRPSPEA